MITGLSVDYRLLFCVILMVFNFRAIALDFVDHKNISEGYFLTIPSGFYNKGVEKGFHDVALTHFAAPDDMGDIYVGAVPAKMLILIRDRFPEICDCQITFEEKYRTYGKYAGYMDGDPFFIEYIDRDKKLILLISYREAYRSLFEEMIPDITRSFGVLKSPNDEAISNRFLRAEIGEKKIIDHVEHDEIFAQYRLEDAWISRYSNYKAAINEIKKSAIFNEAKEEARIIIDSINNEAKNWMATIDYIRTDHGGNEAKIGLISYRNGRKTSYRDGHITVGTKVYSQITELSHGQRVRFSGRLVSDEKSFTEEGALSNPEYEINISEIALEN